MRAFAQILEVTGGASTLYGAQGGSIHLNNRSSELMLGAGLMQGHFAAGGSARRILPGGGSITVGQQELHMDLPTDVFDTSHTYFGVGLGTQHGFGKSGSFTTFAGALSLESGTPLFRATSFGKLSQYAQLKVRVTPSCDISATEVSGVHQSMLASWQCKRGRTLKFALSGGGGQGSPYLAASAVIDQRRFKLRTSYVYTNNNFQRGNNPYQPTPEPVRENVSAEYRLSHAFSISGTHTNYLTPASLLHDDAFPDTTQRSHVDSIGLQMQHQRAGASVMILHSGSTDAVAQPITQLALSNSNWAFSTSFRYNFGRLQWNESLLHSLAADHSQSTILMNTLAMDVTSHLRLSEGVNVTNNGVTNSHGGVLLTRFSTFQVDYQFFYLPTRPDRPFQQAMLVHGEVYLPGGLSLRADSTISPTGKPLYTFQLGRFFSRGGAGPQQSINAGIGTNIIHGRVVDTAGHGVDGAALQIGTDVVYSDSEGYFFFRERRPKTHPFRVLTDEFLSPGSFGVVTSQEEVHSSSESTSPVLQIVVQHATTAAVAREEAP
jgi:hypothetical protein